MLTKIKRGWPIKKKIWSEVVLLQPNAGSFDKLGARLPLGILTIASLLRYEKCKTTIIDQRVDADWQQELELAMKRAPVCVGLSCMTGVQIKYALELAARIKKINPAIPVIFGGVHPSLLPEQTLAHPNIDIIVVGEGEITFRELVHKLIRNKSIAAVDGIYYKDQKKRIIKNRGRAFVKNLDKLPRLPFELIDMQKYSSMNIEGRSADFSSSRGCPHRCRFCYNTSFNHGKWRALSAKATVRNLADMVSKYKIETVYFQDDNFCVDLERVKAIARGIIKSKLKIKWGVLGVRIDTVLKMDEELLLLLEKSGCINMDIGVESGSERILKMMGKGITVNDVLAAAQKLKKYPFILKYTFMIGFPTETREDLQDTIRLAKYLIKENDRAYAPMFIYTPYPGTRLYEMAIAHGFVPPQKLEEWESFNMEGNWIEHFPSWLKKEYYRELRLISLASLFSNKNIVYKINNPVQKFLFYCYHPIAKIRFHHNYFGLPLEDIMFKKLLRT